MAPLSGEPSTLTVITAGNVNTSASAMNSHEARNLPTIACQWAIGRGKSSSRVPGRRSSARQMGDGRGEGQPGGAGAALPRPEAHADGGHHQEEAPGVPAEEGGEA